MVDDGWEMMLKRLELRRHELPADGRLTQSDVLETDEWTIRSGGLVTRDADEPVMTCEHLRSLIAH